MALKYVKVRNKHSKRLTNSGLTKPLIGNLIGNIGPH